MVHRTISAERLVRLLGTTLDARGPAYRALADGIRLLVTDGRVPLGSRLPSERDLTVALGTSRTTVAAAYRELRERGYLVTRRGSGSVTAVPGGSATSSRALTPGEPSDGDLLDLTCAASAAAPGVARAFESAMAKVPALLATTGYAPAGLPALREAVAARYTALGAPTTPDQVIVTSGALAGLAVTVRAFSGTGDRVLMESPTYPNALETVSRSSARPVGLPLDHDGWDLGLVHATLRQTAPRLAYLLPDFQNPTGMLLDDAGRADLARLLRRSRTLAVVDETMADLALDDSPRPLPMAAFHDDLITLGSTSKSFWGGLRVGWIRAPLSRVGALLEARATLDLGTAVVSQLAAAELLADAEEVLQARRAMLRESRDILVDALRRRLPGWEIPSPPGGLALWCTLPDRASSRLAAVAEQHGVVLTAGPRFAVDGGLEQYLRVPFGADPELLREAAARIAAAWEEAQHASSGVAPVGRTPLIA